MSTQCVQKFWVWNFKQTASWQQLFCVTMRDGTVSSLSCSDQNVLMNIWKFETIGLPGKKCEAESFLSFLKCSSEYRTADWLPRSYWAVRLWFSYITLIHNNTFNDCSWERLFSPDALRRWRLCGWRRGTPRCSGPCPAPPEAPPDCTHKEAS